MNELREALDQYLSLRRSLGFQLRQVEAPLRSFIAFAEEKGASYITPDLMLRWAQQPSKAQPATKAVWLAMVRRFALWRSSFDPRTEVPPENLLSQRYHRQRPYIYQDEEVKLLVRAAAQLPSKRGVRGPTYSTFFGLIAATGMRLSEGLALD